MSLKDDMAADVELVFFDTDEFAEIASYNGTEILVIPEIGDGTSIRSNPHERGKTYENAIFTVKEQDVPNPCAGDTIVYENKEYEFAAILEKQYKAYRLRFTANDSIVATALGRI